MEFKGTQGPWRVEHLSGSDSRFYREGYVYAVESEAEYIACIEHDSLANARLIAAAPELLSFAIDVRDNYDCDSDAHKYGQRCRKCEAARVIAKALGESS